MEQSIEAQERLVSLGERLKALGNRVNDISTKVDNLVSESRNASDRILKLELNIQPMAVDHKNIKRLMITVVGGVAVAVTVAFVALLLKFSGLS